MSLLIKGGDLVDGSGSAPRKCDVLVIGKKIAALGDIASYKADKIIQASGFFIAPGFIDSDASSDRRLSMFVEPQQTDFLRNGVSTIVCGTEGMSLSPLLYGDIKEIGLLNRPPFFNIGWRTTKEYLEVIKTLRLNVNFATFTGYKTIRRSITSRSRNLGKKELKVLSHLISQNFNKGSLGISVGRKGFEEFDAAKEELSVVAGMLEKRNRAVCMSLSANEKFTKRTEQILSFAERGIRCIVGGSNREVPSASSLEKIFKAVEKQTSSSVLAVSFSPYPYYALPASDLFPETADMSNTRSAIASLDKKRIFSAFSKKISSLNPSKIFVSDSFQAGFLVGKSIAEFGDNRGIEKEEAFIRLIEIGGTDMVFLVEMDDPSLVDKMIVHPKTIMGSGLWSPMSLKSGLHKKLSFPFSEFLRKADSLGMPIEAVIKKTSVAASVLGLKKRGMIKEGFAADIVVLKDNIPRWLTVGGEIVLNEEIVENARSGEIIV